MEVPGPRNQSTVRALVAALRWQIPATCGGWVTGIPGEVLRRIEYQARLPPGGLYEIPIVQIDLID